MTTANLNPTLPTTDLKKVAAYVQAIEESLETLVTDEAAVEGSQTSIANSEVKEQEQEVQQAATSYQQYQAALQKQQEEAHRSWILQIFMGIFNIIVSFFKGGPGAALLAGVMMGLSMSGELQKLTNDINSGISNPFVRALVKAILDIGIGFVGAGVASAADQGLVKLGENIGMSVGQNLATQGTETAVSSDAESAAAASATKPQASNLTMNFRTVLASTIPNVNPFIDLVTGMIQNDPNISAQTKQEIEEIVGTVIALLASVAIVFAPAGSQTAENSPLVSQFFEKLQSSTFFNQLNNGLRLSNLGFASGNLGLSIEELQLMKAAAHIQASEQAPADSAIALYEGWNSMIQAIEKEQGSQFSQLGNLFQLWTSLFPELTQPESYAAQVMA